MRLVASRELPRHPWDVAPIPGGGLVVLSFSEEGTFCEAYDADLAPVWSTRIEGRTRSLRAFRSLITPPGGTPWVLDATGARALGERGVPVARVGARAPEGLELAAFARVEDGFVFACHHAIDAPMRAPTLQRVDDDGTVRWSTTLPVGPVAYGGVVEMSAAGGWRPRPLKPWTPKTWLCWPGTLTVSGDAVLACFSDVPSSGIGLGYVVSLSDGALRFTTQQGPVQEVAPLGGGAFLVGYQGYGAFETLRYERDGLVSERWASHGYYVVRGDDVRVIEMENTLPSGMHLARLLPGGSVRRGAWLDGYDTSRPYLRADGTAFFFRKGALLAARALSIDERLVLHSPGDELSSTRVVGGAGGVFFAYAPRLAKRGGGRLVRVEL